MAEYTQISFPSIPQCRSKIIIIKINVWSTYSKLTANTSIVYTYSSRTPVEGIGGRSDHHELALTNDKTKVAISVISTNGWRQATPDAPGPN